MSPRYPCATPIGVRDEGHPIPDEDFDAVKPHPPRKVCKNLAAILELNAKKSIREALDDRPDYFVFSDLHAAR